MEAPSSTLPQHADTVVVGAGIAGLVAADELYRRGIDVVVLEAADRVGGRVMVETTALGSAVDLGGQWIGKGHHRFETLAAELGTSRFPMRSPKAPMMADSDGPISPVSAAMLAANAALVGFELASHLPARDKQNSTTLRQWLDRAPSTRARRILEVVIAATCCAGSEELSVTAFLALIRYLGGLRTMMKTTGGAQDSLLVEGAGALAERLAARLGDRVHLGCPVTTVVQRDGEVTVTTETAAVTAAKVVVTVPPPMAAGITFDPPLSESRKLLQRNTVMGAVYKALAVYDAPFWRERTDAEMIVLGDPGCAVFDSSPPDGPGHLTLLVGGPEARRIGDLPPAERRRLLFDQLESHLGADVRHPADWHDKAWHADTFVGGGYAAFPVPGTRDGFYPVEHSPTGDIHWAGTETAAEHAGYIEGAIESAHRVVAELGVRPAP